MRTCIDVIPFYRFSLIMLLLLSPVLGCDSGDNEATSLEKVCRSDPGAEVCDQKYALCIAASCDHAIMTDTTIECGQCDKTDRSCSYCYVFDGKSCYFDAPCSDVEPQDDVVYSTYSEALSLDFGFDILKCEGEQASRPTAWMPNAGSRLGPNKPGSPSEGFIF